MDHGQKCCGFPPELLVPWGAVVWQQGAGLPTLCCPLQVLLPLRDVADGLSVPSDSGQKAQKWHGTLVGGSGSCQAEGPSGSGGGSCTLFVVYRSHFTLKYFSHYMFTSVFNWLLLTIVIAPNLPILCLFSWLSFCEYYWCALPTLLLNLLQVQRHFQCVFRF